MAALIGVVSKVIGEVFAVASDGSRRPLSEGDRLFAGEQLETGAQGAVAVALTNGQELTLGRESSLTLDNLMVAERGTSEAAPPDATDTPPANGEQAAPTDQQLTDVEQLQAAIEAGADPTQQGEATAAGPGAGTGGGPGGAGGGRSFVLLSEVGGSVTPQIGFPTEGLIRGPEFPEPEAGDPDIAVAVAVAVVDPAPDGAAVTIDLDEDSDLPGSLEGSPYGDDQPGVPASLSGNLGYNFGTDGPGGFSWNAVDLSGMTSHGMALVAVISADGQTLTAHQGSADGPVVFTATNTNALTGDFTFDVQLPLDHPVAGAEDTVNVQLGYTITDGNGTPAGGSLAVNVNDDSPQLATVEGDGPTALAFAHVGGTVHEDALTQAGSATLALPDIALNAPHEGNNEDSDGQGVDNDPSQTVNVSFDAGPGSLTSLVDFGADGIGSFGLVDTATANNVMQAQGLTSGGEALSYTVVEAADGSYTSLVASVPGADGYDVFTLQVGADGSFSFTLQGPLDHALANGDDSELLASGLGIDFTQLLTATDFDGDPVMGFNGVEGLFTINVEDDVPQAQNDVASVQVAQNQSFNTVFVLDFSGSIDSSELNTMITAVKAAAQALFNGTSGDVHAQIVAFSGDAIAYPSFDNYDQFAATLDSLNSLQGGARPFGGSTDFTDALHTVVNEFTPIEGASNQVFFVSDGNPNESLGPGGDSLTTAGAAEWTEFVNSNNINVSTIGIGDGIDLDHLQQVDVDGSGSAIVLDDFDDLVDSLVDQVTGSFVNGNVLLGSDGAAGGGDDDNYGADGPGYIQSVVVNGVTYTFDGTNTIDPSTGDTISGSQLSNVTTAGGGSFSFDFATGAWSYKAPNTPGGDKVEQISYTIIDHDGDPSTANLTINVEDASPIVAAVDEDELPGGITDNDGVNTVATGSLSDLSPAGSTPAFSLGGDTSGLPAASSHGVALAYSVVGDTLTAKAGAATVFTLQVDTNGDYTFTLSGPLDHPAANGNDGELLTLDFASIVQATQGGSPLPVTGGFLISIEDDVPTAVAIAQNGQASTVTDTNLMIVLDTSGSMLDASGVGNMSRLDVAKASLLEVFEQYDAMGEVKVSVVSFATEASTEAVWVNIADAKAAILGLQASDSTNFDAALIAAINAYGEPGKIAAGNVQNVAYFLSDGEPNVPTGDAGISDAPGSASGWPAPFGQGNTSEEQAWISFLNTNNVRAYSLGMGTEVTVSGLDPIAYDGVTHTNTGGTVVTDMNNLTSVLVGTAQASPLNGNLTTGGGFGSDGGYVRTLSVDGKTFTYDKTSNSLTVGGVAGATTGSYSAGIITLGLASGGSLAVNVNSGAYTFTPPSVISTAIAASIIFTLIDLDGDTASAALNIAIGAGQAPMVVRDDLVLTNADAQSGIDHISLPAWALLANDTGPSHNLLSVIASSSTNPGEGTVTHDSTAPVFNEQSAGAKDGGSFTYTASVDGVNALDTAVVTVDRSFEGQDTVVGTFRNEVLLGRDGEADNLQGRDGDDILLGLSGNDRLEGGNGNDILIGGLGNDALIGGEGVDTASYHDATSAVTANLNLTGNATSGGGGIDSFSSIENLIGSDYNDTLIGNSASNYLNGGAGDDSLNGGGGADYLVGGQGADTLTGGAGNDTFVWEKGGLGNGTDHITDFTVDLTGANSDVLDLSQLLSGVAQNGNALDDYLTFSFGGGNTTIGIATSAGSAPAQTVVLDGVNLSSAAYYGSTDAATVINGMISDHALKTDTV